MPTSERAPRIALLKADDLREFLQQTYGNYQNLYYELLAREGYRFDYRVYDVVQGEFPNASEVDGVLISGSRCGVYEDHEWIARLLEGIRTLYDARIPIVGICFGHQALAQALGGEVKKSEKGYGLGWQSWRIVKRTEWMSPPLDELRLYCIFQDQVMRLPPDAERVATNDFCPNGMFTIPGRAVGMQPHPEFHRDLMRDLVDFKRDAFTDEVIEEKIDQLSQPVDISTCAHWIARFFNLEQEKEN